MQKKRPLREADVTAESVFFMQRRQILKALGIGAAAATLSSPTRANLLDCLKATIVHQHPQAKRSNLQSPSAGKNSLSLTPEDKVTGYNNFYEFGLDKADPAANAGSLKTDPWTMTINGEVNKPLTLDHDALDHSLSVRRAYLPDALR
ncbi:putative sulfite oxidase subunit YedY [Citrobacter freundii]|nr:putative sulfite oxidase subunit YedY [Citrobacter freundii]